MTCEPTTVLGFLTLKKVNMNWWGGEQGLRHHASSGMINYSKVRPPAKKNISQSKYNHPSQCKHIWYCNFLTLVLSGFTASCSLYKSLKHPLLTLVFATLALTAQGFTSVPCTLHRRIWLIQVGCMTINSEIIFKSWNATLQRLNTPSHIIWPRADPIAAY